MAGLLLSLCAPSVFHQTPPEGGPCVQGLAQRLHAPAKALAWSPHKPLWCPPWCALFRRRGVLHMGKGGDAAAGDGGRRAGGPEWGAFRSDFAIAVVGGLLLRAAQHSPQNALSCSAESVVLLAPIVMYLHRFLNLLCELTY